MSDNDGGLPEESSGKLEQTPAVEQNPRAPWKLSGIIPQTFQNYNDLLEFGDEVYSTSRSKYKIVIVIDNNEPLVTAHYPQNKQFFIGQAGPDGQVVWRPYTEFFLQLQAEGRTIEPAIFERFKKLGYTGIQISTYQSIPIIVPDPSFDHNRPTTEVGATTSTVTGNTVVTTTTTNPAAAGVTTTSEIIPAEVAPNPPATTYDDAILRQARNAASAATAPPCLPNNPPVSTGVSGSGATPPSGSTYDDGPLRALRTARAAAAAPVSTGYGNDPLGEFGTGTSNRSTPNNNSGYGNDPLGEFGGVSTTPSGAGAGRGNGAAEVARRRADAAATSAPTTVTRPPSTPTPSSTPSPPNTSNVYIYEPLTPGFDRYDFNSGKKVFTPDTGPSLNASSQPVSPSSTPRVSPAPLEGGIAVGTTTGGPSLLRQRQNISNRVGDVDQSGRIRGGL